REVDVVRADCDVVDADEFGEMSDVVEQALKGRLRADEGREEADDDVAAPGRDRLDLLVGEVPRVRPDRSVFGVRGDDRSADELAELPEALLGEVRHVEQAAEAIELRDDLATLRSQPARVGRADPGG